MILAHYLEEPYLRSVAYYNNMRYRRVSARSLMLTTTAVFALIFVYYTIIPRDSFSFSVPGFSMGPTSPKQWKQRATAVKGAFQHAWRGYEQYAMPHDELCPLTNMSFDKFNGWGVTLYDSLDTLYLMGMDDEFSRALQVVEKATFSLKEETYAPFFETVIRYLGGLLSAYAMSKEPILLTKADELARLLSPIFGTPSGFPAFEVNTVSGTARGPEIGILAEIASFQMEYTYLAQATGEKDHNDKASRAIELLAQADLRSVSGMFPKGWNLTSGKTHDMKMSVGAAADSAHEYLLKQYLLTGKTDKVNLEMYLRFTTYVLNHLVYISAKRNLVYVTDKDARVPVPSHIFEHLSCFLPGLLTLGAQTLPLDDLASVGIDFLDLSSTLDPESRSDYTRLSRYNLTKLHMWAAQGIAETCYLTYADQPSSLGPDEIQFSQAGTLWMDHVDKWWDSGRQGEVPGLEKGKKPIVVHTESYHGSSARSADREYGVRRTGYLLRPETLESLYLLWRTTGDIKWREYGWTIFEAIEKHCKAYTGYASVYDVEIKTARKMNDMPSYFMAETLKYLYLMFLDDDPIDLNTWVFNTEGHPLPVFHWTAAEKAKFGIKY